MITLNNKMRKAYAEPLSNGWYVHRASNHLIWRHPGGGSSTTAKTPSDHRAMKNALAYFRREDALNGR